MSRGKPGGRGASYDAGEPLFMYDLVLFLVILWGVILFGSLLGFIPKSENQVETPLDRVESDGSGDPSLKRQPLHKQPGESTMETVILNNDIDSLIEQAIESSLCDRPMLERMLDSWSDDTLMEVHWNIEEQFDAGRNSALVALFCTERELFRRGIEVPD